MAIGRSFKLQRRDWQVAGVFDADGSAFESEIWGDVDVIGPAFNRGGYHWVTLRLRDPSMIGALNSELEHNPRMQVRYRSANTTRIRLASSPGSSSDWR